MAMEKLILRSVLYGADKIPDSWFEKLPGGYFKEKSSQDKTKHGGKDRKRSRRHSTSDDSRHGPYDRHRDDGYRYDHGRRRDRRERSSYDGGADDDDDDYDTEQDRRSWIRYRDGRRRSLDNGPAGYDKRHSGQRDKDRHLDARARNLSEQYDDHDRPGTGSSGPPPNPFSPNKHVPTVEPINTEAAARPTNGYQRYNNTYSPAVRSPQTSYPQQARNTIPTSNGYTPYGHVYGQTPSNNPQQKSTLPSLNTSARPAPSGGWSPVAPPPSGYQQNTFAQEASTAVDAGAGMRYTGQPNRINEGYGSRSGAQDKSSYDLRPDQRSRSERRGDDRYDEGQTHEEYVDLRRTPGAHPKSWTPPHDGTSAEQHATKQQRDGRSRQEQGYYSD